MSDTAAPDPVAGAPTRVPWRRSVLACMADYIDAGSIVAAAAGLALWAKQYGMTPTLVGLLGALGTNAASYAVGALIGGRLGDRFGRKRIYQWDLLVYVLGGLIVVLSQNTPSVVVGLVVMGLAVGADVPTSWALVGEIAPTRHRGRMVGLTSVFWNLGPVVTLLLSLALAPLGTLGIRLVFLHLVLVAFVTWLLRRGMAESERWVDAARADEGRTRVRELLQPGHQRSMWLIFVVHMAGSVAGGTFGFFLPFILSTLGAQSQAASVGLNALNFGLGAIGVAVLFMPLVDRVNRRLLYGIAGFFSIVAALMLVFLPITSTIVVVVFIVINALAGSCGQEQMYRVWCQELFPTMLRSSAQGIVIFVQKILLAVWSYFVPLLILQGNFAAFAWVLAVATTVSVVVGTVFMPRTRGRALEDITGRTGEPAAA